MRKLLMSILLVASFGFVGLGTEAKANTAAAAAVDTPQLRIRIGQRHNRRWRNREYRRNGYGRTYTQTRLVRRGYATYRETYQIRYLPNGETYTTLISRVRVA
jgi:hypothetical protein